MTSLTVGLSVCWKPTAANTATAPTLAVNGLTATTITKVPGNSPLVPNDLLTSAIACAIYDGTQFELQDPQSNVISATATANIASQACNGGVAGTQTLPGGGKCTFVYNDGRYINDATTTLNSSTITCPNSDCGFTAADVGKFAWVFTSVTVCPISTIQTVNNANSITLTAASDCTSAVTGTGTLWWGHKDTANLTSAWSANGCGDLKLPTFSANPPPLNNSGAFMFVDGGEFTTTPAQMCGSAIASPYAAPSIEGGIGSTFLIMTPDFNWTTCPSVANTTGNVCFGAPAINVRGLFIRSAGFTAGPASPTAIFANMGGRSESVNVAVSQPGATQVVDIVLSGNQTHFSQGGGQGGSPSCQAYAGSVYSYASFCTNHQVVAGATWIDAESYLTNGTIDGTFIGTGTILVGTGGINTASKLTTSGAKVVCTGCAINPSGANTGAAGVWAFANNTIATLYGSTAIQGGASGNPLVVTGTNSVIQDGGGNALPGSGAVLVQGAGGNIQPNAGNGFTGTCTGVATASATLGLYGSGPNVTTTTCTGTTLGTGIVVNGSGHTIYNLGCYSSATTVSVACTVLVNGSPVASTCTMTATTFCNDGTHQVALNNGDSVSVKAVTGVAETGANLKAIIVWN